MRRLFIALVRGYQFFISPYFPSSCRYYPTCSNYAIEAIRMHGVFKGVFLAAWRILRCNPWSAGGEDPVPKHAACRHCKTEQIAGNGSIPSALSTEPTTDS